MQAITFAVVLLLVAPGGDREVSAPVAANEVEAAFGRLTEPLRFQVTLAGVEYRPKGTVPEIDGLADLLAEDCSICDPTRVATDELTAGGGYKYVLDAVHKRDGISLTLSRADGEFLWSWVAQDGVARESYKDKPVVEQPLPPGNVTGTNLPLTYESYLSSCPVRSYRTSLLEQDGKIRGWFSRQIARSERQDSEDADVERWIGVRRKTSQQTGDGSSWERTDVIGLDRKSHLPVRWESREVYRSPEGAVTRVIYKTKTYRW